ncbi:fibronectin type III domain-containing protein 7-like [Anguilla anguilla]|uniref:fibronectin type III domain-containing protein 7-like n=1 Tax=Anguilla anguilla TaxID=7936 RepID=UPI0015B2946F|nr:fibronectin type III domain-containing protein 7-like [Anguilla anguilla]XP_035277199.1 fibronectin type III domain-containing protein 7-like [Anguilla anguilla]
MGLRDLKSLTFYILFFFTFSEICAAQNGITVSIYTVTSKTITARWTRYAGASSYKLTATPINSPSGRTVFAQFGGNTVMGSISPLSPNTVYTLRVEAMDNSITVLTSAVAEGTTAPDVPHILGANSKQSHSITVEFTSMPGATAYVLRAENEAEGLFSEIEVPESPGTISNLQPFTMYTLSVMSVNSGGRSQPSLSVEETTVLEAPQLSAFSPSNDTIMVTWEPVEHAVLYTLCIIMEGSEQRIKLNTTNTTMDFTVLQAGTVYSIKANAWDPSGTPGDDITLSQITRPPSPGPVTIFPSGGRSVGMEVNWRSVQGADEYLAVSSSGQNCTTSSASTFCVISPLECGQIHSITVVAENTAGPSSPSDPENFLTFPCPPESSWVEESVPGNCSLRWPEVNWVDYYTAFVKRDDGVEIWCNTTTTKCNFYCNCGYTYFMTVFSYNQAGSSPPGPMLNYTTIPCCPEDVAVSLVSTETLEIGWTLVRGAEVYQTRAAANSDTVLCNDTSPVCVLSDLTCNSNYSVVVTPCSELRGCNHTCRPHTGETAPCSPEILSVSQINATSVNISWSSTNRGANYVVKLTGSRDMESCQSRGTSCKILNLPCGTVYEVTAIATTSAGNSLPSYAVPLETAPCCPGNVTVRQMTQASSHVTWSPATGAEYYVTSLSSPRGDAKCHTLQNQCVMGCITCGTNYTVSMEAISRTGHKSECTYHGFSSSACCPSNVRLYRMTNNTIRVHWRASGNLGNFSVDLRGAQSNYTCTPPMGATSCDVSDVVCGDVYSVVVAPVSRNGTKIEFCPRRMYSVSCAGSSVGMVIYRGRRSVD